MVSPGDDSAVDKTAAPTEAPADDEPLLETASRRVREPAHRRWLACTLGVIVMLTGTPHAPPHLLTRTMSFSYTYTNCLITFRCMVPTAL